MKGRNNNRKPNKTEKFYWFSARSVFGYYFRPFIITHLRHIMYIHIISEKENLNLVEIQ